MFCRAREEELSIMKPQDTYIPQLPPGFSCEVEQAFYYAQETKSTQNSREVSPSLPPSFTSLLASCHPEVNPGRLFVRVSSRNISIILSNDTS